jgi:divalent metal cation (Fe/Co/Zn/Cd) transporter
VLEGSLAVYFGLRQHQVALLVFGSQSIIEIAAAALVLYRFQLNSSDDGDRGAMQVERLGSRAVGVCLVLLCAYAVAKAVYDLVHRAAPDDSTYGLVVAGISAVMMFLFWILKVRAADVLGSPVLRSDAKCSQMCMSLALLVVASSVLYMYWPRGWWVDSACAMVLALKFGYDGVLVVQASYKPDFAGGCACCA